MEQNDNIYIAHSANSHGIRQTMKEHSFGVGKLMREFALSESFADLYEYCGLIHDMGKYSDSFQKYIAGDSQTKVQHAIFGSIFALENKLTEVALPVFGHHAGLPNNSEMRQKIMVEQNTGEETMKVSFKKWSNDTGCDIVRPEDKTFWELSDVLLQELFVRMLFSSLVDADSLDTERHFWEEKFFTRKSSPFNADEMLGQLQERLKEFEDDNKKKGLTINRLRNEVRLFAESKANLPQGCFSLTLPTGLGKTLCSLSWALHHAQYHRNIKRIIVVLPFINIIEQTAEELKKVFKSGDYVLEHHSNVVYTKDDSNEEFNSKQLATENWDYAIIITTAVQFFESLFSNKRSHCRKLHNIQDSIIIFDEIQTLPLNVTAPTLTMLDNLQSLCRCSILFCTATQPDFRTRLGFNGINHIEPLVKDPKHVFEKTRRVTYHPINNYNEIPISELADSVLRKGKSALVVFNTKKKAQQFYNEVKGCNDYYLFHLSTNMCPRHRKETIRNIKQVLIEGKDIIVSSTQLIEAGVDMDFPAVYREIAPLESIIQSAGRCNREGQLKDEMGMMIDGDVYLFALIDSCQPSKEYRSWAEFANLLYKGNEEMLYAHDFYAYYYRKLVENFANTDKFQITDDRRLLNFQDVADKYKIIDNSTQAIFVFKYNKESRKLYNRIKDQDFLTKQDRQEVAQYCVQVYEKFIEYNEKPGNPLIATAKCGIKIWNGSYDPDFGIPFKDEFNPII